MDRAGFDGGLCTPGHPHAIAYAYGYPHSDANRHANIDPDRYANSNPDSYANSDPNSHPNADPHAYTHA